MMNLLASLLTVLIIASPVLAQQDKVSRRQDPFDCLEFAKRIKPKDIPKKIKDILDAIEPQKNNIAQLAHYYCVIAELKKRSGDYEAEDYYVKAIDTLNIEPAYELLFADYLRNFRGPQHPLFPQAERHYFEAKRKLGQIKDPEPFDAETRRRVERGLIALYQEDGVPLLHWNSGASGSSESLERPYAFFASVNKFSQTTTDFDRVADVRDFTSEALFSASKIRLNRSLTRDELRGIIRSKDQIETFDRLRFRYKGWPAFDVFYKHRTLDDAQITNFFAPNKFNDVKLDEYGVAVEKPFSVSQAFDLFLRGIYKRTIRKGLIEFLPNSNENVNHFEAKAIVSRFVGPDKVNLEFNYVFQDINPDVPNPAKRDRTIVATTFTYQIFRPLPFLQTVYDQLFATRGIDVFAGYLQDKESFGNVEVRKQDFFFGTTFKGLGRFDIGVQPTIFTSEVETDKSQRNSQYRTNVNLLYRIKDEEREPGVPENAKFHAAAFNLLIPFRHDVAIDGLKDFENFKIGVELNGKFFTTGLHRTTFLASLRYDYQRFYKLNRNLNLLSLNISMGF